MDTMTRKEEREQAARNAHLDRCILYDKSVDTFIKGAEWADNYWQNRFNKFDLTSKGRLYTIWLGIKSRCNNKNNIGYYRYGVYI